MGKFYEYPTPTGISEGDEKIVMEKGGVTYSPSVSYIALSSLGDVDTKGIADGSLLKWSTANSKWEIATDNTGGVSGSFTTTDGKTITVLNGIVTSIV